MADQVFDPHLAKIQADDQQMTCPRCGCCTVRWEECSTCAGCGQIANDDDQSPWKYWASLPPPSNLAVVMGLVRPEICPRCEGTKGRFICAGGCEGGGYGHDKERQDIQV